MGALSDALWREGLESEVRVAEVGRETATGFSGSPTILVDGRDLFPEDAAAENPVAGGSGASHCRLYETPGGLRGYPTAAMVQAALRTRL